jgi:hypothetical protein
MAQLTPTTFTTNEAVTAAKLTSAFSDVATAFNAVDSTNLAADSVPLTALATDGQYYTLTMHAAGAHAGAIAVTVIEQSIAIPVASSKIVAVSVCCTALSTGGSVDIYTQTDAAEAWDAVGRTVLSAPIAIAAVNTGYSGTVAITTARAVREVLSLRLVVGGGNSLTDVTATILMKNQLLAY